jgi:hypothetical protein
MEKAAREVTLNERLNKMVESLQYQCDRLESVLSRVNGTPPTPIGTSGRPSDVTPIKPTLPLSQVVEMIEALQTRLSDLATGVERIA